MLIRKFPGFLGADVQRWVKAHEKRNQKLIKFLLSQPATRPTRQRHLVRPESMLASLPLGLSTSAPANASSAGQWLKFSHPISMLESGRAGGAMSYWLYLPSQARTGRMPLVVMLHGCTQTAVQFAQSTRMNRLAEKEGFAVLYPQQNTGKQASRCWRWFEREVCDGQAEAKSVVTIINKVVEQYALDHGRIYIAGISAGAAMANIIALNHPHLIAAVGLHSGSVFGVAQTPVEGYTVMQQGAAESLHGAVRQAAARLVHLPAMPAILIHGQEDGIVKPINLAHLAEQFRELHHLAGYARDSMLVKITDKLASERCSIAYKTYEYYFGKKNLLRICEISELGHAWSGGDESVNFSDGRGPDASRMMWDFFARHQRAPGVMMACVPAIRAEP